MYTKYFDLTEKPFDLNPDPRFLYLGDSHKEAFAHLKYAVEERKGLIVITGEVGTGKTTLINALLAEIDPRVKRVHLTNPGSTVEDLFYMVNKSLDLPIDDLSEDRFLSTLDNFVRNGVPEDERILLLIDEAHDLSTAQLEEVRLLSDMETSGGRLFQIFLVGRPELNVKPQTTELQQLWQRIDVKYHLIPLDLRDTINYVRHRLGVAGYKGRGLFHRKAMKEVHRFTKGCPRLINILCDHALFTAYSRGLREIKRNVIEEVIKDIRISHFARGERREPHAKVGLCIIVCLLLTGLSYGIYSNGGIKGIIPSQSLDRIDTENGAKKFRAPVRTTGMAKQDEELAGVKDVYLSSKEEEIRNNNLNEILVVDQAERPIPEEAMANERNSRILEKADAITDITSHTEGDVFKVVVTANGMISRWNAFSLDHPTRLVIDVFEVGKIFPQKIFEINNAYINRIRIGTHPDKVRLCLDSSRDELPPHRILGDDDRLVIVIGQVPELGAEDWYNKAADELSSSHPDHDLIIDWNQRAIGLKPDYAEAYNNLGLAYYSKGLDDKAIASLKKAIGLKPDCARTSYNLGVLYFSKGLEHVAADYLYRAGFLFLEQGEREYALMAYGFMKNKMPSHKLTSELYSKLYPPVVSGH